MTSHTPLKERLAGADIVAAPGIYDALEAPGLFHDETVRIPHVRRQRALQDPGNIDDVLVVGTAPSVG